MGKTTLQPNKKTAKFNAYNKEVSISQFIPFLCHWDSKTIITKNYDFFRVIEVKGYSFETADDEDLDIKKTMRNTFYKSIAIGTYAVWVHTIRTSQSAFPDGDMPSFFAQYTNKLWREKQSGNDSFKNTHYITILRKKEQSTASIITETIKKN